MIEDGCVRLYLCEFQLKMGKQSTCMRRWIECGEREKQIALSAIFIKQMTISREMWKKFIVIILKI